MTRVIGSTSSASHAVKNHSESTAQETAREKKLGLGSFKPHLPKKPSDIIKDPSPKPSTIGSIVNGLPGTHNIPKLPVPEHPPGTPGFPKEPIPNGSHRLPTPSNRVPELVHGWIDQRPNRISDLFSQKPTLDPRDQLPANRLNK